MAAIVPTVEFPLATPFTFQLTLVSVVFVTVAVNVIWLPSRIERDGEVTFTVIEGGGGGGGATVPVPAALQPRVHAPAVRRARKATRDRIACSPSDLELAALLSGRGRMPLGEAGEGPAKKVRFGVED